MVAEGCCSGGGGGVSTVQLVQSFTTNAEPTISSTSYADVSGHQVTLPSDGKQYLVIAEPSITNESGVANTVGCAFSDGTLVDVGERRFYNQASGIALPATYAYVFQGNGQTVKCRCKVSNNSCRWASGSIYGQGRILVIRLN